jgi:hypothetical protein
VIDVVEDIPGSPDDAVAIGDGRTILGMTVSDEHGILAAIHLYLGRDPETRFPLGVLLTTDNLTHTTLKPLGPFRARKLLGRVGALNVREVKLMSLVEQPLGIDLRREQWHFASKIHHDGRLLGIEWHFVNLFKKGWIVRQLALDVQDLSPASDHGVFAIE